MRIQLAAVMASATTGMAAAYVAPTAAAIGVRCGRAGARLRLLARRLITRLVVAAR
jgi:hypothetical protein